jgi:hypothetical protein
MNCPGLAIMGVMSQSLGRHVAPPVTDHRVRRGPRPLVGVIVVVGAVMMCAVAIKVAYRHPALSEVAKVESADDTASDVVSETGRAGTAPRWSRMLGASRHGPQVGRPT